MSALAAALPSSARIRFDPEARRTPTASAWVRRRMDDGMRRAGVGACMGLESIGASERHDVVLKFVGVARGVMVGVAQGHVDAESVRGLVGELGAAIEDVVRALSGLPAE